jgi:PAS domain S-box-containing protein
VLKNLNDGKNISPFEIAYKSKTGKKIITEVSARPKIENNKVISIHAITRDITEKKEAEEALKSSEIKYQQLIDIIKDAVFTLDKNGKITYLNKIAEDRTGLTHDEWINYTYSELAIPEYQEQAKKNFQKVLRGESVPPFVIAYQNKQKKKVFVELNTGPIFDSKKNIIGVHGISRDISDRIKILEDLRKSEELYRTLLQTSPDPIVLTDLQGKILKVSSQSLKMFGATSEKDLVGKNAFSFIPPEELPKAEELYKKTLEEGYVKGFELKALRKDNSFVFFEVNTGSLKDKNNQPFAFFGIYRDVTDRKKVDEKLRESEEKYRTIFDTTTDIIFSISKENRIQSWNKTAEKISGYSERSLKRKNIDKLPIFTNPKQILSIIERTVNEKSSVSYEILLNSIDNDQRLLAVKTTLMKNEQQDNIAILFTAQDISEKRDIHKRLEFGRGYLILDEDSTEGQYIFQNLITDNIKGLHITRFTSKHPQTIVHNKNIQTAFLSLQNTQKEHQHHIHSLDELLQHITTFVTTNRCAVIYLDRLDYLISLFSFEKVLQIIYCIHDQIKVHHGLMLFRIPKDIINSTQQALLIEELNSIPEPDIETINLSEDLFNILSYVKYSVAMNKQVTFNKVEKALQISKVTTRKRLLELQSLGLIRLRILGRKKSVYLTDKGKLLLEKRRTL